jgi:hypothetical protein
VHLLPLAGAEHTPFHDDGLGAAGAGKLGTTSACSSITLALCAWASNCGFFPPQLL